MKTFDFPRTAWIVLEVLFAARKIQAQMLNRMVSENFRKTIGLGAQLKVSIEARAPLLVLLIWLFNLESKFSESQRFNRKVSLSLSLIVFD